MTLAFQPLYTAPSTYAEWCKSKGVSHAHCPLDCDHPQPFPTMDGRLLCGSCWHVHDIVTEMLPCTPGVCADA